MGTVRRWMIVLCVAALAVAVLALPGGAKEKPTQELPILEGSGTTTFGMFEVWTGNPAGDTAPKPFPFGEPEEGAPIAGNPDWTALMNPKYNKCKVVPSAEKNGVEYHTVLEWTGKNTAILTTVEQCVLFGPFMPRIHTRPVHISPGGAVKLGPDEIPFFPNDPVTGDHWLVKASGCGLNGTFPTYHGTFDFETGHLYAESHFQGICDGGERWGEDFGIGKEDGPMQATFTIDLTFADANK